MLIYLDNCCYNRPFDDRSNIKNYLEREAVLVIMQLAYDGKIKILGSDFLQKEILSIKYQEKKYYVQGLYDTLCSEVIHMSDEIIARAKKFQEISTIRAFDSLHLSAAESRRAVLLTTDKKFLNICSKLELKTKVYNPIQFIMEVDNHGSNH